MTAATSWHRPHVGLCQKVGGARLVFSRHPNRKEAEIASSRLAAVGCFSTVELARPSDVAGLKRRD